MAPLPQPTQPTIEAIYRAYEQAREPERSHLGASLIGRECERALWYSFRWATDVKHPGRVLRLFERGQREEDVFNANLRAIGIEVQELDPRTGKQWNFKAIGGHFGLSLDGIALGILEAPKTWHSLEYKTSSNKLFEKLKSEGIEKAKPEHYAQIQIGLHLSGLTRCFYLVVNKDTDELYSERVRYDKAIGEAILAKAERIISAQEPPPRLSERPDWWQCRFCDHKATCHEQAIPEVNCRTCLHSTPETDVDARWSCARFRCDLPVDVQRAGSQCPSHRFIPALLPWKAIDASETDNWIQYENGIVNGASSGGYHSREIRANPALCADPLVTQMKTALDAEVVA